MVRWLVTEKETRTREGLLMMGLNENSLLSSWIIIYIFEYFIIASICSIFWYIIYI